MVECENGGCPSGSHPRSSELNNLKEMNSKAKKRKRQRQRAKEKKTAAATLQGAHNIPSSTSVKSLGITSNHQSSPGVSTSKKLKKRYLTPQDGADFDRVLQQHYQGFAVVPAPQIPPSFHQKAKAAFEKLRDSGYYQYDMVMAGGKNLSRTFVKRTLVGNPGITYKYLGLRLFAHAWSGPNTAPVFRTIQELNQEMIRTTRQQLRAHSLDDSDRNNVCDYNLTLINYMEPSGTGEQELKEEPIYGMGKASVSWHADSSLEPHSSIGVYHYLPTQKATKWDWRIALRLAPEETAEPAKEVPPVVLPTKSGDMYFLLGDLNHTHQHIVLAGTSANRISSTHRVAVTERDTFDYIAKRVKDAKKTLKRELKKPSAMEWNTEHILESQKVLTEVEFEWIAQYWIQGKQHDVQHQWWQAPMRALEKSWSTLEALTYKLYKASLRHAESRAVSLSLLEGLLEEFNARYELRLKWDERRAEKIYRRRIARPYQPVAHPVFASDSSSLPKDLADAIQALNNAMSRYNTIKKDHPIKDKSDSKKRKHQSPIHTPKKRGNRHGHRDA